MVYIGTKLLNLDRQSVIGYFWMKTITASWMSIYQICTHSFIFLMHNRGLKYLTNYKLQMNNICTFCVIKNKFQSLIANCDFYFMHNRLQLLYLSNVLTIAVLFSLKEICFMIMIWSNQVWTPWHQLSINPNSEIPAQQQLRKIWHFSFKNRLLWMYGKSFFLAI